MDRGGIGWSRMAVVLIAALVFPGRNVEYQLGRPQKENDSPWSGSCPGHVPQLYDQHIAKPVGSGVVRFVLTIDGAFNSFGSSSWGQLGIGQGVAMGPQKEPS